MRVCKLTAFRSLRVHFVSVCMIWLCCFSELHAEVLIGGVEGEILDNVLAYLRLDDEPCDAPDWRIRRMFADADTEIHDALKVVGYYRAAIEKKLETGEGWCCR